MAICEWCGKKFDPSEAEDEFEIECGTLSYAHLRKRLCGSCAIQAINDQTDGVYFETCEACGKTFDLAEARGKFDSHFGWCNGTNLMDYWDDKILCYECAIDSIEEENA